MSYIITPPGRGACKRAGLKRGCPGSHAPPLPDGHQACTPAGLVVLPRYRLVSSVVPSWARSLTHALPLPSCVHTPLPAIPSWAQRPNNAPRQQGPRRGPPPEALLEGQWVEGDEALQVLAQPQAGHECADRVQPRCRRIGPHPSSLASVCQRASTTFSSTVLLWVLGAWRALEDGESATVLLGAADCFSALGLLPQPAVGWSHQREVARPLLGAAIKKGRGSNLNDLHRTATYCLLLLEWQAKKAVQKRAH